MAELGFRVLGAEPVLHGTSPLVSLRLEITTRQPVRALSLRAQVQIEAARRRYEADEAARLAGVFCEGARFDDALRSLVWAHVHVAVPAFDARVEVDVLLPCSPDLRTERGTYLLAIDEGTIPVSLLFSGSIFYGDAGSALRIAPVAWSSEARFDLPAATCRAALAAHHGELALVALPKALVDRLQRARVRRALGGVDEALTALLDLAGEAP
ncbi:MAG TPA: DUF6084 family protein [Byssovorax sp.]